MDELIFDELVRTILKTSSVIEGRYWTLEHYGNELNKDTLGDLIRDELGALDTDVRKYPGVFALPPTELIDSYSEGWSTFRIQQYFLTPIGRTGDNEIKDADLDLNVSTHSIQYDFKDMRECAINFRKTFNKYLKHNKYVKYLHELKSSRDSLRRMSNVGNDNLAGVWLTWDIRMVIDCDNSEYPVVENIPPIDIDNIIHEQHKH